MGVSLMRSCCFFISVFIFSPSVLLASSDHYGVSVSFETSSEACISCHEIEYDQWKHGPSGEGSMHALSAVKPMYLALLESIDSATQPLCKGCHIPENVLSVIDKPSNLPTQRYVNIEEGVNCISCHYDGSKMVGGDILKDPVFCSTCHNDAYVITEYYNEWSESDEKRTCQQCHMGKNGHAFSGLYDSKTLKSSVVIRDISIPTGVTSGDIFNIDFTVENQKVSHSIPSGILRELRVIATVLDHQESVISQKTISYHKRHAFFGENPLETDVLKSNESRAEFLPTSINFPGTYTLKVEAFIETNRFGIYNESLPVVSKERTFKVIK